LGLHLAERENLSTRELRAEVGRRRPAIAAGVPPAGRETSPAAKELAYSAGAANGARADCLRVEVLAQIRIAREHGAAQERGEAATRSDHGLGVQASVRAPDPQPATADELGLDRRRLAEWREMAEAGKDVAQRPPPAERHDHCEHQATQAVYEVLAHWLSCP
jgi:hypothetical protein